MKKLNLIILLTLILLPARSQVIDSAYKSGLTTVQGSIRNFKYSELYNQVEIQVPDWTNGNRRTYFYNVDSEGNFSSSFFIFNTQKVVFIFKNTTIGLFVRPGDTLRLDINADSFPKGIAYDGTTANACSMLSSFKNVWADSIFQITKSKINSRLRDSLAFEEYHAWRDNVYKNEIKILESFINRNKPEHPLKQYFTATVQLWYYWDLLKYGSHRKTILDEESINPISIINSVNIDTLKYDIRLSELYPYIVNMLNIKIHDISTISYNKDHPFVLLANNKHEGKSVSTSPTPPPLTQIEIEQSVRNLFPYYIKSIVAIENKTLRESVLAHYYTSNLEYKNVDLGLDSILAYISNPEIKSSLINSYNSNQSRKSSQNSLKVETNLIDDLISKYKGYVLYIDFWGTWCAPCYESFKYVSDIKEKLQNQRLAFIYLCCRCDKEKWESDVKKYNLDGEHIFLTSQQLEFLSDEFNIMSVPQYIIVDKNGKIVNDHAPRPSSNIFMQQKLINELNKYLKD